TLAREGAGDEKLFAAALGKPVKAAQLLQAIERVLGVTATQSAPVVEPVAPRLPAATSSLRILLADDNLVNQKAALRMLERLGYRPDVAANGVEVLQALRRQTYDVVFMDVQMPELDGLEATRQIRLRMGAKPYIIAMTAHALDGDREMCLQAGMDD